MWNPRSLGLGYKIPVSLAIAVTVLLNSHKNLLNCIHYPHPYHVEYSNMKMYIFTYVGIIEGYFVGSLFL
jgi:hypothetical protein